MAVRRTAVCALVAVATALALAAPAQARRTYCTPTGDYCLGMFKRGGQVYLGIDTFSFRGSFLLCLTSPDGNRKCLTFRLRRDRHNHHLYRSHVKWSDHFPHGQKGLYRAVWRYGGARFPSVTFTVG
jgi:hypothetical protein